jgi:hypothetical protein
MMAMEFDIDDIGMLMMSISIRQNEISVHPHLQLSGRNLQQGQITEGAHLYHAGSNYYVLDTNQSVTHKCSSFDKLGIRYILPNRNLVGTYINVQTERH